MMPIIITDTTINQAFVHIITTTPMIIRSQHDISETTVLAAYLPRMHALHARQLRYISTHDYIPGLINAMADFASRLLDL
jgi:hypothetical protein